MLEAQTGLKEDKKNTIASQLVGRLREAILCGDLKPNSKINLERIRETFDVSLSPLREALARLITDGLVEFEDNRGYRVAPISLENLAEITKMRAEFETFALNNAMMVGDQDWETNVMRALHRLNKSVRDPAKPESFEQWETAHSDFHSALISGCKMPMLVNYCRQLNNLNDRYRRIFLQTRPGDRNVGAEHSEIAAAAVARDIDFSCTRLREHILRTGKNLHSHLSQQLPQKYSTLRITAF